MNQMKTEQNLFEQHYSLPKKATKLDYVEMYTASCFQVIYHLRYARKFSTTNE